MTVDTAAKVPIIVSDKKYLNSTAKNWTANSKGDVVTWISTGIGWGTQMVLISKGFRVFVSVHKQADDDHLVPYANSVEIVKSLQVGEIVKRNLN